MYGSSTVLVDMCVASVMTAYFDLYYVCVCLTHTHTHTRARARTHTHTHTHTHIHFERTCLCIPHNQNCNDRFVRNEQFHQLMFRIYCWLIPLCLMWSFCVACLRLYRGPVYRGLVYRGPVYRGPVYRGPEYRGPVYRRPVYINLTIQNIINIKKFWLNETNNQTITVKQTFWTSSK